MLGADCDRNVVVIAPAKVIRHEPVCQALTAIKVLLEIETPPTLTYALILRPDLRHRRRHDIFM